MLEDDLGSGAEGVTAVAVADEGVILGYEGFGGDEGIKSSSEGGVDVN